MAEGERSAFDVPDSEPASQVATTGAVQMHDPFSPDIVGNDYAFC